jgi:ankyrin repeat protein
MTSRMTAELFDAIERHDLKRAGALLSQGADPNGADEEGWRPLHHAVGEIDVGGSVEFVKLLLQHGADPNAWDEHHHETPILSASDPLDVDDREAARVLLEAGADPNVRRSDGESPLRLAAQGKALDLAQMLLRHGAAKTIDDFGGDRCWTALGHAAHNFDVPMIRLLLEAGADPGCEDDAGDTARDKLPPRETQDPDKWDEVMELLGRRRT